MLCFPEISVWEADLQPTLTHSVHTNNASSANFVVYISSFYHLWR